MTTPYSRVFKAADCRTQQELAAFLGIRQSSVSLARTKTRIPAEWLVKLIILKGVNPEWVLTGQGPTHLSRLAGKGVKGKEKAGGVDSLAGYTARELAEELLRRVGG